DHLIGFESGYPCRQRPTVTFEGPELSMLSRGRAVWLGDNGTSCDLCLMNIQTNNPLKNGGQFHEASNIGIIDHVGGDVGPTESAYGRTAIHGYFSVRPYRPNAGYKSAGRVTLATALIRPLLGAISGVGSHPHYLS